MNAPLPPEIRVENLRDDVTYWLPVRPLGPLRWVGLVPMVFGVVFVIGPASVVTGVLRHAAGQAGNGSHLVFVVFLLPFLAVGCIQVVIGLAMLFGRCRIEWHDRRLARSELLGPFRWRRQLSRPKETIRKLSVKYGAAKVNQRPITSGPLAGLGFLVAEFDQGQPRTVAAGYPHEWLQALAEDLSRRIGVLSAAGSAPQVEVIDARQPPPEPDVVEKPAGCASRMETDAEGITLVVPPAGLWKGSKGLLGFACVWCAFMLVFTCLSVIVSGKPPVGVWLFIAGFWAVGLGMMAMAVNMARRRAMLRVQNGELRIVQQSPFGTRQWVWQREAIAAIRMDNSSMTVNHRPVKELQIHPVGGKKAGFFMGRNEDELRWLASELRRAVGTPAI